MSMILMIPVIWFLCCRYSCGTAECEHVLFCAVMPESHRADQMTEAAQSTTLLKSFIFALINMHLNTMCNILHNQNFLRYCVIGLLEGIQHPVLGDTHVCDLHGGLKRLHILINNDRTDRIFVCDSLIFSSPNIT